jgi:serine/threonine protein kinase
MRNVACRYPKIPHLTIDYSKELGRGTFGVVHLVNNMQDGSNAALKRITLSIAKEEPEKAFTDALSEVSSLQMIQISLNKRVVAYKGFYVETDNFESTGFVHLCILLEYALRVYQPFFSPHAPLTSPKCMTPAFQILPRPVAERQNRHERARARQGR